MADPPDPHDPQNDNDETQMMHRPTRDRDEDRAIADRPDATRVLPVPPQEQPEQSAGQSFGGTYATPPPSRGSSQPYSTPPATQPSSSADGPPRRPPPPGRGSTSARKSHHRHWWVRGLVLVVAAWLVFLVAVPIWAWRHVTKVDADPGGDRPADTGGTTYLLVGSDSREDLTAEEKADLGTGSAAGRRTDTIILLHEPDHGGPRLLLSIPRDSFLPIPGYADNKVNAAYAFGGPELLVQTIEQATDVRIDDYIEVGFTGFVDIVDAVGGIEVCPQAAIEDPKAGDLTLSQGCQDVDGRTALGYSRSRAFALGDITRALHQREVITAVGSRAASWQTVVFPWRYLKLNSAAADTLRIGDNVGPVDLAKFAWAMAHSGGSDAKRCVVPYSSLGASTSAGSAVIWDEARADALFTAVREDATADISCTAQ